MSTYYSTTIGPFAYPGGGRGPRMVKVKIKLRPRAIGADLENEGESEILQFLAMKCIKPPSGDEALASILAYVCAKHAACSFTGGTLKISAGPGSAEGIRIESTYQHPNGPSFFQDTKCEAWCERA